jgi:MFS family permease
VTQLGQTATVPASPHRPKHSRHRARRAALAGFLGSALEYYDFFIYATAASLVFNHVFFAEGDPNVALIQSFAIFGVGYVFRPLGAVLFGHLGDRIGRRNTLVATLTLMGLATFGIGLLPTYEQAGIWAPISLTLLRILQGISAGGETAGASSLSIEESPVGRRAFYPSFTATGLSAGIVLSSFAFIPVQAMDAAARDAWGWRLPFLASIVMLVIAFLVRRTLDESGEFVRERARDDFSKVGRVPIVTMLRTHPVPFVSVALMSMQIVIYTYLQGFGLAFGTQLGTVEPSTLLWALVAGNLVAIVTQPLLALLADRIGRRPVAMTGQALAGVLSFPFFYALSTANTTLLFATSIALVGCAYAGANTLFTSWFGEQFHVRVRYTGLAIALQVGAITAGFSPTIGTALVASDGSRWAVAASVVAVGAALAVLGSALARETYRTPLDQLGNPVR